MSYKLKTLIVFDTNSLRSTIAGDIAYGIFSFGKPYEVVNGYIVSNNLQDDVILAVSDLVIDEIKFQMERSYVKDLQVLKNTKKRLTGLPHIDDDSIQIPQEEFNCSEFVESKSKDYLELNSHVRLLSFKEEQSSQILKSLISRVHSSKPPFFKTTNNSDAGFKDSIIWETLLNYEEIEHFGKVILLTKDSGFAGCESEFISKWNRHFKIINAPEAVNTEIGIDYKNYIQERAIYDYAQTEYFLSYLNENVEDRTLILVDEIEQPIRRYEIVDSCQYVDRLKPDEEGVASLLISSKIKFIYKWGDDTKEQMVEALTMLYDEQTKEIFSTEFDFELR